MIKSEKIIAIDLEIEQLQNEKKKLEAQERERVRKERTNRLCNRGGLLESMLPDTIKLTDEQFQTFFEKTLLTDYTRRILAAISAENIEATAETQSESEPPIASQPADKPAGAEQKNGAASVTNVANTTKHAD
jgi:hypothetical protein